jgi:hypothetical protein
VKLLSRIYCALGLHGRLNTVRRPVTVWDEDRNKRVHYADLYEYHCTECGRIKTKKVYF